MKHIISSLIFYFFISCSSFPLEDVSKLRKDESRIHSDRAKSYSNSKPYPKDRNLPEAMVKSNFDVGDTGILLANHLFSTQGRTPNHLDIYHIQDDNFIKDAIAKYFEYELYFFQTGLDSPRKLSSTNPASQHQLSTNDSMNHLFQILNQKDTSKFTSSDPKSIMHQKATNNSPISSSHTNDPRQIPNPIPTSLSAFLPDDKPSGPKIIESKIHGQKNSVASDHTNIEATDGHTHTEFMVKSYQNHGNYKNSDVENVVISNGITAME
ncbi:uncharacterized protein LOC141849938 [Brevipalpus obovatus]|uniref:uncharacterized protein LOC141849938 n=1 Tax=Brevipalpus obovatus TaxID=246614 RepID=UPI003D9EC44E